MCIVCKVPTVDGKMEGKGPELQSSGSSVLPGSLQDKRKGFGTKTQDSFDSSFAKLGG